MAQWFCQSDIAQNTPLTVGKRFYLMCKGEPILLDKNKIYFLTSGNESHTLDLQKVVFLSEESAQFEVVSYRTGEHKLKAIKDDKNEIAIDGFSWKVASVLPPDHQIEAYAAYPPIKLNWPTEIYFSLGITLLFLILIFVSFLLKHLKRKRFQNELKKYDFSLTAYQQLNKELRNLYGILHHLHFKTQLNIEKLDHIFKVYLMREFEIETLNQSDQRILKEFKKKQKVLYSNVCKELKLLLNEFQRFKKEKRELKFIDLEQMIKMCREVAQKLHLGSQRNLL